MTAAQLRFALLAAVSLPLLITAALSDTAHEIAAAYRHLDA